MISFFYDYVGQTLFGNGIGPDNTGVYYKDTGYAAGYVAGTYTISSLDNYFSSFTYIINPVFVISDTVFCDMDNGNDSTGTGTYLLPVKSIWKAGTLLDGTHDKIGIMTSTVTEDYIGNAGYYDIRTLSNATIAAATVKIFALGHRTPFLAGQVDFADSQGYVSLYILNSGSATTFNFYNVYFNYSGYNNNGWDCNFINSEDGAKTINLYNTGHFNNSAQINVKYPGASSWGSIGLTKLRTNRIVGISGPGCNIYMTGCWVYGSKGVGVVLDTSTSIIIAIKMTNCIIAEYDIVSISSTQTINKNTLNSINSVTFGMTAQNITRNIFSNITTQSIASVTGVEYNCDNNKLWPGIGNIKRHPSFVSASPIIPEDFKIQTIESGFQIDSFCYLSGNEEGTENIGAYQGGSITSISYRKYELLINPDDFKPLKKHLGHTMEIDLDGRTYPQTIGLRRPIVLGYREFSLVEKKDGSFLDYIATHPLYNLSDPFGKVYNEIIIKIFENINTGYASGTLLSYDDQKKILTVDEYYRHDQFIENNIWLIWKNQSGAIVTGNIISGFLGMIINEHQSKFILINGFIYQIISNTATTITVADFYKTLIDNTYDVIVFNSFQIKRQVENQIYISDLKNVLASIPNEYMINGYDVVAVDPELSYNILGYNPAKDLIKWNRAWNYITTIEQ